MYEFPWQFGYGAFALYLVGIAQTLGKTSIISEYWSRYSYHVFS